ncbi:MAG: hypothetical protein EON54_02005 [Alcaligenaceae bacterium]|nr:MAG: hypothetical protein EON54_02005 [Alcaligenaceae bacterium]
MSEQKQDPLSEAGGGLPVAANEAQRPIATALEGLLEGLRTIRVAYFQVVPKTLEWLNEEATRVYGRIDKFRDKRVADGYDVSTAHEVVELSDAIVELKSFRPTQTIAILERSLFTQIFSQYDSFIGALLKAIYSEKHDLLKGISREITLSDLLEFESLDAVKLTMLEKEIETFRRDSYVEQFAALEKKFGFKTLRDFAEWGEFVELAQRRNVITHNDAKVSEQYLAVCDRESHRFGARPALGETLDIKVAYFSRAILLVSKVAFMLTHTLWRKLFPGEHEQQYMQMNATIYEGLQGKRWRTTAEMATFSMSEQMCKGVPELQLRMRLVNCVIAFKFSDREGEGKKLLASIDWTASYRDFKLALAVLNDDFEAAGKIMREIGKSGELVNQIAYHRWPLFHKFQESDIFQTAYEEVYGESFAKKVVEDASNASVDVSVSSAGGDCLRASESIDIVDVTVKKKPPRKTTRRKPAGEESVL